MEDADLKTPTVKVVGFEVTSEEASEVSSQTLPLALQSGGGGVEGEREEGEGEDVGASTTSVGAGNEDEVVSPKVDQVEVALPPVATEAGGAEAATEEEDTLVHGTDEVKQVLLQAEDEAHEDPAHQERGELVGATTAEQPQTAAATTADAGEPEDAGAEKAPGGGDAAPPEQQEKAGGEPPLVHLSLRSPVMILPQTESMTHSPMHGKERRAVDSLFIGSASAGGAAGPQEEQPKKYPGKKLELDDHASPAEESSPAVATTRGAERDASGGAAGEAAATSAPKAEGSEAPKAAEKPEADLEPVAPEAKGPGKPAGDGGAPPQEPEDEQKKAPKKDEPEGEQQKQKKAQKAKKPQKEFVKKEKPKLTKAERRALQEKQRAAKAALKGEQQQKGSEKKSEKTSSAALSRPRSGPQSEFDNEKKLQRHKRKSLVPRETQEKSVELFSHLPQFDNKTLPKSFQSLLSGGMHPEVVKLGQAYANLSISGGNARCLAMLAIFKLVIQDYNTPAGKSLTRDLTNHINVIIQFLIDCRPLAVTMGNAIRYFKTKIGSIDPSTPDMEAKKILIDTIDQYIQDKIIDASDMIADVASSKIREGDVILTYAFSSSILKTFKAAHERGSRFRVIVVDSRPHFEGRKMVSKLADIGISCTYAYITSLSYIMPQVTSVFIGAASALANGTVVSRVGAAAVAVTAKAFNIPVVVCCETYKFSHRVQLDAITHNELGDPDALAEVKGRPEITCLQNWNDLPNLRLLNLRYDALAEKFITMIATEVGMIPPSSVPVILREYNAFPF
ncbi:subunit delta of translation initiation factor eIF-2B [Chloropicon primus]|uniref:Translation initiation factor eIF2B subunit delta n=1 Tax=Chloropicon primus TaxID=1764295 RepID=A0A5B8MQ34_9CHLO|nr:subunit delta of translation initiation factor eIF-2B [Chloropicon primus]UPR01818.1 subunit delta of translation initiation factor eIF-2B [Chloropicon primus]|eukprot:QDZ22596.1 subunit delta of translation initiation factor eIF-2B [Chloropicon primus]